MAPSFHAPPIFNAKDGGFKLEKWQIEGRRLRLEEKKTWSEVYERTRHFFPNLTAEQAAEKVRRDIRYDPRYQKQQAGLKPVGVAGDIHAPFAHPNYLTFLQDTFKLFGVGKVVFIGDLFDHYSYSRFIKKPLALNPKQEKELALKQMRGYYEAFPMASVVLGNHDTRYIDRAEEFGIDAEIVKAFKDIYHLPKNWSVYDEHERPLIINDVLYLHGTAYGGQTGARQAALTEQMSVVMGHAHAYAGVWPIANKRRLMFGMNVGCGIDIGAYAFAYNKKDKFRPLLGCGIVFNPSYAIWVPMGKKYFRT